MELAISLLILFIASISAFWADVLPEKLKAWIVPLPAAVAFYLLWTSGQRFVTTGEIISFSISWVPQLDLDFALRLTGVGLLMGLLITGIGTLILLYATAYMKGTDLASRLYAYLYAFMFSMVGVVLADHMILVFVFWELTSITSYLLIGFNHKVAGSRANALQALVVTGLGGMALMGGFILLQNVAGTWLLSELSAQRELIIGHAYYPGILTLIILGTFTKSAQFPFHFWLPNAMAAPTPVSAYLHSATMVKAGIYLLCVMLPVLGGTPSWSFWLSLAGGTTFLIGGLSGLKQHDLKRILAASTLAILGLLTLTLGIGTEKAVLAGMILLLAHALYKAALFMTAGSVDHEAGTRDVRILGGLGKLMPWTAGAAGLAAVSLVGLPPLFGFIGKEYLYKAGLSGPYVLLLMSVLIFGNALLFILAYKAAFTPYWKRTTETLPKKAHEAPWPMRIGPLVLAVLGLYFGLFAGVTDGFISTIVSGLMQDVVEVHIALWHGINLPLILSGVTVLLGACGIFASRKITQIAERTNIPGTEKIYDFSFKSVLDFAYWQTRFLQSGYLRNYLLTIIVGTAALAFINLWFNGGIDIPKPSASGGIQVWILTFLMLFAILFAIRTQSRLTALISLGIVGFGVSFFFAHFSAPDLAITQILVETLTVALFAWVVCKLPAYTQLSKQRTRVLDAVVSILVGILITILILNSNTLSFPPSISETLAEWSYPKAQGSNVVNVILVDFRALDTWGEITVLAIAALGVYGLLKQKAEPKGKQSS